MTNRSAATSGLNNSWIMPSSHLTKLGLTVVIDTLELHKCSDWSVGTARVQNRDAIVVFGSSTSRILMAAIDSSLRSLGAVPATPRVQGILARKLWRSRAHIHA